MYAVFAKFNAPVYSVGRNGRQRLIQGPTSQFVRVSKKYTNINDANLDKARRTRMHVYRATRANLEVRRVG